MKNGSPLSACAEELNTLVQDQNTLTYYQEALPSPTDQRLDKITHVFMSAGGDARQSFQESLLPAARSLFGIYGHRAATRAMREKNPQLLRQGLTAAVISNYTVPDRRRLEVGLAVYYHVSKMLAEEPAQLFRAAAVYARSDLAARFIAFGGRPDVTLQKYGWKEVNAIDGVEYRFDWT